MSSLQPYEPSVQDDLTQFEQWDRILLAPPPHDSLSTCASFPAQLDAQARTYLRDRLSRHSSSNLSLAQLRHFLDHLFRSIDNNLNSSTSSDSSPELATSLDASSLTDIRLGSELPQTPRLAHATTDAAQPVPALLSDSPRAKRVRQCFHTLSQCKGWSHLVSIHSWVVSSVKDPDMFNIFLGALAQGLHLKCIDLTNVINELSNPLSDAVSLKEGLRRIYQDPPPFLATSDPDASAGSQLAYYLVHLAMISQRIPRDLDVLATNTQLLSQFGRLYRGDAPRRFLNFITKLNYDDRPGTSATKPSPYFRGTPIVQSSGTGKSRMVVELTNLTPLLYVCLRKREADVNAKAGYPLPDKGVRNYFEEAHKTHQDLCDLQVACFLSAWFQKLVFHLRSFDSGRTRSEALSRLNRFDRDNASRREFFQEVSELAAQLLNATPFEHRKQPSIMAPDGSDASDGSGASAPAHAPNVVDNDFIFRLYLSEPLHHLHKELAPICNHLHSNSRSSLAASLVPPAVVAFDECVEINVSNWPKGNNQLNSLLRAWHYVRLFEDLHKPPQHLWLVLLSTSSSAAALIEHISVQSSIRRQNSAPVPTFVGIGFDVLAEERPSIDRASDASQFQQIVTYGRPLWASLATPEEEEFREFWSTARLKLLGANEFDPCVPAQCFAVLASRLALRLSPVHWGDSPFFGEQKAFLDQVVDRNMRILTHVTEHATMHVDSPSEPVLAIAASLEMVPVAFSSNPAVGKSRAKNWYGAILHHFVTRCLSSRDIPIFKGSDGELAARIVLTTAWDAAKERALRGLVAASVIDQAMTLRRPLPLWDVIDGLAKLNPTQLATLQRRIESVQGTVSRRSSTAKVLAWTNFTHFDALPQSFDEITPEYLWYCWKRGVALQMAHLQTGIDGIIPVFIGDLDERFGDGATSVASDVPYGARHMTFVAWEAKNRTEPQPSMQNSTRKKDHLVKLAGPLLRQPALAAAGGNQHAEAPLTKRALLCILTDFGTNATFQGTGGQKVHVEMIKYTDCPRLCIRGVADEHTYPCLDHFELRDIFHGLLDHADEIRSVDKTNTIPHPLWNNQYRPTLPAIPIDSIEGGEQSMDLD